MTKLIDTYESLLIDVAIICAAGPLTVEEIAQDTGLAEADLRDILRSRMNGRKATLVKSEREGVDTYELTPARYVDAKAGLQSIRVSPAGWARAERRFNPPGRPQR